MLRQRDGGQVQRAVGASEHERPDTPPPGFGNDRVEKGSCDAGAPHVGQNAEGQDFGLLAKIAGAINGSMQKAVSHFAAPLAQTARVLEALRAKAEADPSVLAAGAGDAGAPAAQPEETAPSAEEAPAAETADETASASTEASASESPEASTEAPAEADAAESTEG